MKNWFSRLVSSTDGKGEQKLTAETLELPLGPEDSGQAAVPNRQAILTHLHQDCQRQLEMLRLSLQLETAALLWSGPEPDQISLHSYSSTQAHLKQGPYPFGVGVTGVLKGHAELILAPVRENSPAIPYYANNRQTGSFLALRLMIPATEGCRDDGLGILCVDRKKTDNWTDAERKLVVAAAEHLFSSIVLARQLLASDRDRHAYRRAFDGVRKLNSSLGVQSAFEATAEAVRSIVPADFLSIALAEGSQHRIVYAEGENAKTLIKQSFPLDKGLVGQVLKYGRTLPEDADYKGTSPVFSEAHLFADYRSLMIVPLKQEEGPVIGALIVASRQAGSFSRTCREMLELVAAQIAIKLDLAQAHEQINRLATVDSLTGIANRRAYQRGFEAMLDRAKRRSGALYLILCDIDHFKRINDRYGHPVGDEVLRQVASLFDRVVRTVDLAARTGGEEFAILLEDADEGGALKVAERLRCLVEELQIQVQGQRIAATISLGVAAFPQDATSMEKLVSCADKALYRAKEAGRNRSILWRDMAE